MSPPAVWFTRHMELALTDRAAAVIARKGGTAVVDLLEPYG